MKAKRVWSAVLCAGLALSMCVNAGAAAQNDELRAAASYVSEQGVMVGDQNGDMALDQTLSRTELAVILTRITVNPEHLEAERELYTRKCAVSYTHLHAYDWLEDETLYVYVSQEKELAAFTEFFMNCFATK